jgi:hypothetical protein
VFGLSRLNGGGHRNGAVKVELTDGREFIIREPLRRWTSIYRGAAASNSMLQIKLTDGKIMPVHPMWVRWFEEVPEEEAERSGGLESQLHR